MEGFYFKPRIDKELLAAHSEGIICLSGCVSSELSRNLIKGGAAEEDFKEAIATAQWFQKVFGERYFIEIMNNGVDIQRLQLEAAVDLAKRIGLPLVATSDAHYINQEDAEAQDVMLCINTGKFRTDTNRMKMENNSFFVYTALVIDGERWPSVFKKVKEFRQHLRAQHDLGEIAGTERLGERFAPRRVDALADDAELLVRADQKLGRARSQNRVHAHAAVSARRSRSSCFARLVAPAASAE